jgi:hypothetical protein
MKITTFLTLIFCFTSLGWSGDRRILDLNFKLKSNAEVELKVQGATVEIEGHSGRTLNFFAKIEGRAKFVDDYDFVFDEDGQNLKIIGRSVNDKGWWGKDGSVNVKLQIPKDLYLSVKTSGGNIRARNMERELGLRTSGGDVLVRDVKGIEVHTSGGNVELINNDGDCSLSTSGGNIYVEKQTGDTSIRTSGGNIRMVAIDGEVSAKTSGGDIRIELHGTNHGIDARTSGGNLYLYAKDPFDAELTARTSGGRVSVDFPMKVKRKRDDTMIEARINDGGPQVLLRSSGGNIKVREL